MTHFWNMDRLDVSTSRSDLLKPSTTSSSLVPNILVPSDVSGNPEGHMIKLELIPSSWVVAQSTAPPVYLQSPAAAHEHTICLYVDAQ